MSKKFFFFLLIFSSIFLQAHLNQSIIVDRAIQNEIYKSHVWHRLLHLDANKSPAINSNSFLLSYDNFSPKEELIKTINYFFENEENICRYPARYLYIQNELQLNELNFSLSNCKDFDEYIKKTNPKNLKLVFVSEQVNSPSSMMGHTFFKLEGIDTENKIRENAVSFFTVIDTINIPYLILKSTVIGMKGFFILSPYKIQKNRYLNEEERNIWEYELNISDYQKKLIYYHFWELKNLDITYLFTGFNCATIVDDMLGIANEEYKNNFSFWITPKDVIKKANNNNLLGKTELISSNVWTLNMLSESLPKKNSENIQATIRNKNINNITNYSFSEDKKIKSLEVSLFKTYINYLKYNLDTNFTKQEELKIHNFISSQEDKNYLIDVSKYKNPIKTFDDSQFSISYQNLNDKEGLKIGFIPASNTLYDDNREYFSESSLRIGEFSVIIQNSDIKIDELNVFVMKALIPWNSMTQNLSNDFKLNYEKQYTKELKEFHAVNMSGGIGISKKIHEDIMLFSLMDIGIAHGNKNTYFYIYPQVGLIIYEILNMKSVVEYEYIFNQDNSKIGYHDINIEQSLFINKKYRIGVNYNQKQTNVETIKKFALSFNYFF